MSDLDSYCSLALLDGGNSRWTAGHNEIQRRHAHPSKCYAWDGRKARYGIESSLRIQLSAVVMMSRQPALLGYNRILFGISEAMAFPQAIQLGDADTFAVGAAAPVLKSEKRENRSIWHSSPLSCPTDQEISYQQDASACAAAPGVVSEPSDLQLQIDGTASLAA